MLINKDNKDDLRRSKKFHVFKEGNYVYHCFERTRIRNMALYGKVNANEVVDVELLNANFIVYSVYMEKIDARTLKKEESVEVLVGLRRKSMIKASKIIRKHRPSPRHLEDILEEFNLPDTEHFDDELEDFARKKLWRYVRNNTDVKNEYTFGNTKEYLEDFVFDYDDLA